MATINKTLSWIVSSGIHLNPTQNHLPFSHHNSIISIKNSSLIQYCCVKEAHSFHGINQLKQLSASKKGSSPTGGGVGVHHRTSDQGLQKRVSCSWKQFAFVSALKYLKGLSLLIQTISSLSSHKPLLEIYWMRIPLINPYWFMKCSLYWFPPIICYPMQWSLNLCLLKSWIVHIFLVDSSILLKSPHLESRHIKGDDLPAPLGPKRSQLSLLGCRSTDSNF